MGFCHCQGFFGDSFPKLGLSCSFLNMYMLLHISPMGGFVLPGYRPLPPFAEGGNLVGRGILSSCQFEFSGK